MTLARQDFRTRKIGAGRFIVSQRVGSGWHRLADVHASREAARQFIDRAVSAAR